MWYEEHCDAVLQVPPMYGLGLLLQLWRYSTAASQASKSMSSSQRHQSKVSRFLRDAVGARLFIRRLQTFNEAAMAGLMCEELARAHGPFS